MLDAMESDYANPSSENHSDGWRARAAVEGARQSIAANIGCGDDELIFTSGATESNNIGVIGAALGAPPGRRRILVGATEHKAVLEPAFEAKKFGFEVQIVPVNSLGVIDEIAFSSLIDKDVAVVSIMMVNNEIGNIQDLEGVVRLSNDAGAFVHTDATQAPLSLDIDLSALGVDAASFSGHKIYGPKGVGGLYISATAPWRPTAMLYGGGQERGLRPGTVPTPLVVAFAEAFKLIGIEGPAERQRVAGLLDEFFEMLHEACVGVVPTPTAARRHPGNLHVKFAGIDAEDLLGRAQPWLSAATGSACTSGTITYSHVLEALGQSPEEARQGIRFSLGRFTSHDDLRNAVDVIKRVVSQIRAEASVA